MNEDRQLLGPLSVSILKELAAGSSAPACSQFPRGGIRRMKRPFVFHLLPHCVSHTVGCHGPLAGKNYMWLWWLICFPANAADELRLPDSAARKETR